MVDYISKEYIHRIKLSDTYPSQLDVLVQCSKCRQTLNLEEHPLHCPVCPDDGY
jgi:hypothetical protein